MNTKLGAAALAAYVNSFRRLRAAQLAGCHSADGTCLAFNPPAYIRDIPRWLDALKRQPCLALDVEVSASTTPDFNRELIGMERGSAQSQ